MGRSRSASPHSPKKQKKETTPNFPKQPGCGPVTSLLKVSEKSKDEIIIQPKRARSVPTPKTMERLLSVTAGKRIWVPSLQVRWTQEIPENNLGTNFSTLFNVLKKSTMITEATGSIPGGWLYRTGTFKLLAIYTCLAVKSNTSQQFFSPPRALRRQLSQPWPLKSCCLNVQNLPTPFSDGSGRPGMWDTQDQGMCPWFDDWALQAHLADTLSVPKVWLSLS